MYNAAPLNLLTMLIIRMIEWRVKMHGFKEINMLKKKLETDFTTHISVPQESSPGDIGWMRSMVSLTNLEPSVHYDYGRLLGLVFAPEGSEITKRQIVPRIHEWHCRSADHINFYFAGYDINWDASKGDEIVFSDEHFSALRAGFQGLTSWKYSGELDLILLVAYMDKGSQSIQFDFSEAVVCRINQMIMDRAIGSVGELFESVFHFAEEYQGAGSPWGYSDLEGINLAKTLPFDLLLSCIPKPIRATAKAAKHYVVRDISPNDS